MLTGNTHQALRICIGPPTYNRVSHPPDDIEIHETTKPESNDEVEIIGFRSAPASGVSGSKPGITHDNSDIVIIKTKSESSKEFESDSESDEDMFMVHFQEIPPLTLSLIANRERSQMWGRCLVTAEAWHQLGRLVGRNGERDVPAQGLGQAQL
jgi:hypothetical protein